jgi:H+/Cl- antiporter ClcA
MTQPATRRAPCPQCRRRRQRLRAHSPLLNTLTMPIARWAFTLLAVAALYAGLTAPALVTGAIAALAWRYH